MQKHYLFHLFSPTKRNFAIRKYFSVENIKNVKLGDRKNDAKNTDWLE